MLESLLSQKKLIKAHQVAVEKREGEEEEERNRARSEARERVLKDFERTQSALGGGSGSVVGAGKEGRVEEKEKEGEDGEFESFLLCWDVLKESGSGCGDSTSLVPSPSTACLQIRSNRDR